MGYSAILSKSSSSMPRRINTFIFQSMPDRFDLRTGLIEGKTDTWVASRYRKDMQIGDLVYFWMGGDERFRGLYGYGELASEPFPDRNDESFGVKVRYIYKFNKPILSSIIKSDDVLQNLLINRNPQATNFLLEEDESKRLLKLVRKLGEKEPKSS
jgi:hypothetical protein